MKTPQPARRITLVLMILVFVLMMSCSSAWLQADQPNPTLTALYVAVKGTVTANALVGDVSSGDLATAQAKATGTQQNVAAAQTESAVGQSAGEQGTATVSAPIIAELQVYALDTTQGRVGWIHDPLTLEVEGYQQFKFGNDYQEVTASDFVLAADITWDTQYGSNGCGFMFRSDGDQNKPNQYMVLASRFGSGHVVFTALLDGELNNIHDFFPKDEDRSFSADNQTTNRLAVVARGNLIQIFTNNVKIGEVDTTEPPTPLTPPAAPIKPRDTGDKAAMDFYTAQVEEYTDILDQFKSNYQIALGNHEQNPAILTDGFLGMVVMSESGRTSCAFTDAWLWLIED
jgi:hypothetical protein